MSMGIVKTPVPFLNSEHTYWALVVFLDVWKEMGWWTIVFLAAVVGVNQDLNEAAAIDGAGRLKRIWHIKL